MHNSPESSGPLNGGLNPKKGHFDVLHSQTEEGADVEHRIPIKIDFANIPKPTELEPLRPKPDRIDINPKMGIKLERPVEQERETEAEEKFAVPAALIAYLDRLIIKGKRPLKGLKFDVEESSSVDEIVHHLSYSDLITPEETEEMLAMAGHSASKTEIHREIKDDVEKDAKQNTRATNVKSEEIEDLDQKLSRARLEYAQQLVPYLEAIRSKRSLYLKLMSDLGVSKDMPLKDKPRELVDARKEYLEIRKKKKESLQGGDIAYDIEEISLLRREILNMLPSHTQEVVGKGIKGWDKIPRQDNTKVLTALADNLTFLSYTPPPEAPAYEGLRVKPEDFIEKKTMPKVAEEIKPEVLTTGLSSETKTEKLSSNEVVFPLDFEGKRLEVVRGGKENPKMVRVVLNGEEIASGTITDRGPDIKIDTRFKAGFLLAETEQERAFKKALSIMNTLKP